MISSIRVTIITSLVLITSCTSVVSAEPARLHMLDRCPLSGDSNEKSVESVGGVLALAVIPPLVESAVKGVGSAIKKAGESKTFTTAAVEGVSFYALDEKDSNLMINPDSMCLVAFSGKVGGEGPGEELTSHSFFKAHSEILNDELGLVAAPNFYYEAWLKPSPDGSAFKLEPKNIYYGDRIGPNKRDKELVVTLNFSTPSAEPDGESFALFTHTFKRPSSGELVAVYPHDLKPYSSGYRGLPAASVTSKSLLADYVARAAQLKTFSGQLQAIKAERDPGVVDLEQQLADAQNQQDSKIAEARRAVDRAIADNLAADEIKKLKRKLEDIEWDETSTRQINDLQNAVASRTRLLEREEQIRLLRLSIDKLTEQNFETRQILNHSTPVNVTVSLAESTSANKFLVALGEALEGAAAKVKEEVQTSLTPTDPEAALKEEITRMTASNELRVNAIEAVETWRKEKGKHESAPAAEKPAALAALRIAYLKARLECDIAEASSVIEPNCLGLTQPPSS